MKLKAPEGVGEPCVAGVAIIACDGLYDVEADVGALLMEAFGFVEATLPENRKTKTPALPPRRRVPAQKL